mmetsp:Transcript_98552/g.287515  ORF Transcript_98552/g.287515 Transcript_98552/m.287515 type:complete len:384 (+) Transcript_98552:166-1317(+)
MGVFVLLVQLEHRLQDVPSPSRDDNHNNSDLDENLEDETLVAGLLRHELLRHNHDSTVECLLPAKANEHAQALDDHPHDLLHQRSLPAQVVGDLVEKEDDAEGKHRRAQGDACPEDGGVHGEGVALMLEDIAGGPLGGEEQAPREAHAACLKDDEAPPLHVDADGVQAREALVLDAVLVLLMQEEAGDVHRRAEDQAGKDQQGDALDDVRPARSLAAVDARTAHDEEADDVDQEEGEGESGDLVLGLLGLLVRALSTRHAPGPVREAEEAKEHRPEDEHGQQGHSRALPECLQRLHPAEGVQGREAHDMRKQMGPALEAPLMLFQALLLVLPVLPVLAAVGGVLVVGELGDAPLHECKAGHKLEAVHDHDGRVAGVPGEPFLQ